MLPPAGAHVRDIEARDADGKSVHFPLRRHLGSAAIDEAHVRARPAHVQGDELGVSQKLRDAHRGDDPGGRAGVQHLDRSRASVLARENPTRRLHDEERRLAAPRVELLLEVLHVARDHWGKVRGHDRRGGALVLAKGGENVREDAVLSALAGPRQSRRPGNQPPEDAGSPGKAFRTRSIASAGRSSVRMGKGMTIASRT